MRHFFTKRRIGMGAAILGFAALLAFLLTRPDDARAARILAECEAKIFAAKTFSADVEMTYTDSGWDFRRLRSGNVMGVWEDSQKRNYSHIGTVRFARPHKGRLEIRHTRIKRLAAVGSEWAASDGDFLWLWSYYSPKSYRKTPDNGGSIEPFRDFGAADFFFRGRKIASWDGQPVDVHDKGRETVDGVPCDVIEIGSQIPNDPKRWSVTLYIGNDRLVRRTVQEPFTMPDDTKKRVYVCTLQNIVLDAPIPASVYTVKPPVGAHIESR